MIYPIMYGGAWYEGSIFFDIRETLLLEAILRDRDLSFRIAYSP